jgi:DNA-binding Lrp family transcriptional regulator
VDELDSAIVALLQEDARQSNRDIARKVGIAPSTCLERIRLLRERGVIRGYHADIDHLHSFLADRLAVRKEVVGFRSSIIFRHLHRTVLEPLPHNVKRPEPQEVRGASNNSDRPRAGQGRAN